MCVCAICVRMCVLRAAEQVCLSMRCPCVVVVRQHIDCSQCVYVSRCLFFIFDVVIRVHGLLFVDLFADLLVYICAKHIVFAIVMQTYIPPYIQNFGVSNAINGNGLIYQNSYFEF